jgi:phosphoheptose isomerase
MNETEYTLPQERTGPPASSLPPGSAVVIHTAPAAIPIIAGFYRRLRGSSPPLYNLLDESLLPELNAPGAGDAAVRGRLRSLVLSAASLRPSAVMSACSSIGSLMEELRPLVSFPLLRIDEPMITTAVQSGGSIGIIASHSSSLEPTADLLRRKAEELGMRPEVQTCLIEEAGALLSAGDSAGYDRLVAEAISAMLERCSVVVLAQVSMARAAEGYSGKQKQRILTSLESGTAALAETVSAARPETVPSDRSLSHLRELIARYPVLQRLSSEITSACRAMIRTFAGGGKILACGNGGSAADADHLVAELMKGFLSPRPLTGRKARVYGSLSSGLQEALPALSLVHPASLNTAYANDVDPAMVFAQQVQALAQGGDLLIAFSTSGSSVTVVNAARAAKAAGIGVISFTGRNGGRLRELSDICLSVDEQQVPLIQELHLPLYHTLCAMVEAHFFPPAL